MIAHNSRRMVTAADCAPLVDTARRINAIHLPAVLAGAIGEIDVTFLTDREAAIPKHLSDRARPHLIIVGDDPDTGWPGAFGPSSWRCSSRLQYLGARFCYVHGSGGAMADYAAAVGVTRAFGRVLMVETASAEAAAWGRLMERHCETVVQLPIDGAHPVRRTVH